MTLILTSFSKFWANRGQKLTTVLHVSAFGDRNRRQHCNFGPSGPEIQDNTTLLGTRELKSTTTLHFYTFGARKRRQHYTFWLSGPEIYDSTTLLNNRGQDAATILHFWDPKTRNRLRYFIFEPPRARNLRQHHTFGPPGPEIDDSTRFLDPGSTKAKHTCKTYSHGLLA